MNSLEEKIYRIIQTAGESLSVSEIASLAEEDEATVYQVLSSSMELNIVVEKDFNNRWHIKDYSAFFEREVLTDPELLLIIKRIKDHPELRSLFDTTKILKTNEIGSVLEYSEWSQAKDERANYNDKRYFPRYRRVKINWDILSQAMESKGYSIWALCKQFGISTHILYASKRDNKMNPFILEELCDFLKVKVDDICEDFDYTRVRNGVSRKRRVKVDWPLLVRSAKDKGYNLYELAEAIGKGRSYLMTCRAVDGINEDVLKTIADVLDRDYRDYLDNRNESLLELVNETCEKYKL